VGSIRSSLDEAGQGRQVAIEGVEALSFEGKSARNMGVVCSVSHLRGLKGQCFVIVMRLRGQIVRAEGGGRRSWVRRCLFVGLWVEMRTF
jgi:hypothetical protein